MTIGRHRCCVTAKLLAEEQLLLIIYRSVFSCGTMGQVGQQLRLLWNE